MSSTTVPNPANGSFPSRSSRLSTECIFKFCQLRAMLFQFVDMRPDLIEVVIIVEKSLSNYLEDKMNN